MANKQKINIVSNGELQLAQPKQETALNIPLRKWNKIKERIKGINCDSSIFSNAAYAIWGISGSSLLSMIPFVSPLNQTWLFEFIFIATLIFGYILYIVAKKEQQLQHITKENVLEYMKDIDESFDLSDIKNNKEV